MIDFQKFAAGEVTETSKENSEGSIVFEQLGGGFGAQNSHNHRIDQIQNLDSFGAIVGVEMMLEYISFLDVGGFVRPVFFVKLNQLGHLLVSIQLQQIIFLPNLLFSITNSYRIVLVSFRQSAMLCDGNLQIDNSLNMLHPSHNLGLAEEYFETLSEESLSVQFNLGLKYEDTLVNKFLMLFNIKKHYKELGNFYPYTSPITTAAKAYGSEMEEATRKGLIISAVSIFSIYQLARRGVVLPFLKQYGKFFKTHRVFRHYIWAAVLPVNFLWFMVNCNHFDNCLQLWKVHARRMGVEDLVSEDPKNTFYPSRMLGVDMAGIWSTPYIDRLDLQTKLDNEVRLADAPDYANPEFEAVEVADAEGEGEGQTEDDEE